MDPSLIINLFFLGIALSSIIFYYLSHSKWQRILALKDRQLKQLEELKSKTEQEKITAEKSTIEAKTELSAIKSSHSQQQQYLQSEFKQLAQEIVKTSQKELAKSNSQNLQEVLIPMRTEIKQFKDKVEQAQQTDIRNTASLKQEFEQLRQANFKITQEAQQLTKALQGDKQKQGAWGEVILARVLESSGLREGHEYKLQVSLKDSEENRLRPDAIVYLPNQRQIVVDAKTSLNAYKTAVNSGDTQEQATAIKALVQAIEQHIESLSEKQYHFLKDLQSLDFVLMFIPIEGALLMALNAKPKLYDQAFQKNIILVSPSTLQLALRTVEATWKYERQQQNILAVAEQATKLYDKFSGFIADMESHGKHLSKAEESYQNAFAKLHRGRGNLIGQAAKLHKLASINSSKKLPDFESLED